MGTLKTEERLCKCYIKLNKKNTSIYQLTLDIFNKYYYNKNVETLTVATTYKSHYVMK